MDRNSIQFRVILGITVSLAAIALLIAGFAIYTIRTNLAASARSTVEERYQGMIHLFDIYKANALGHAQSLARHPGIIAAAKRHDTQALFAITTPLMKESKLDYMVITDPKGFVIIRTHEPGKIPAANDNIAKQINVSQAMKGKAFVAIEEGKVVKLSVRAGAPLYDETGTLVGVLSTGYVISQNEIVDSAKKMFNAEFSLFLQNEEVATTLRDAAGKRMTETALNDPAIIQTVLTSGQTYHGINRVGGTDYTAVYGPLTGANGKVIGMIFAGIPTTFIERVINSLTFRIAAAAAVALVIVILAAVFFIRRLLKPLQVILEKVQEVAAGNLRISLLDVHGRDEIARLGAAVNTMINNLRNLIRGASQSAEQVAASSQQLTASANQAANAANQVAGSITEIASGTEKQSGSATQVSAVAEQISGSTEQISSTADKVAEIAKNTSREAKHGRQAIEQAVDQMQAIETGSASVNAAIADLAKGSQEIGEIVNLISTIAGQTNLLALNAAIEAARAGEHGRGFAVVAEEVRKLAEESNQAAQQITALIEQNQTNMDQAVAATQTGMTGVQAGMTIVNSAGETFKKIADSVVQLSGQIEEITQSIHQIADDGKALAVSISEVDKVSKESAAEAQTVSAATEEQSASMQEIAASSQSLARLAGELQQAVAKFQV
ncbi:Hypothetical protein LUCI_2516 [Lucifera butyrica]|uniref:Chemotaxis methyl-accepting receptor n=1 Tax=Lucifera butyrica TaxID=1351585 RepID=A0A498RAF9_9FIRM|nr:methyl-accepting chemotaxis protein [Lucifera butyrica]VBB07272.1 Hypothetical protein LUCI_2516 [Lucifera butyrica]